MTLEFKAVTGATEGLREDIEVALFKAVQASDFIFPTDEPLAIEIVFFCGRPAGARASAKWPIGDPPCHEVTAAVRMALRGVVFRQYSHVVSIKTDKRYCVNGMEPHTRVEIWAAGTKRYNTRPGLED